MNGADFIDEIEKRFNISTDAELADRLGYTPPNIVQLRRNENILPALAIKIMTKLSEYNLREKVSLISPIVEFFPIDRMDDSASFINLENDDRKELKKVLMNAIGICAFYNSEMEIIYVGKTKLKLWNEMLNAYKTRKMIHYRRFYVNHAWGKYGSNGLRKIIERDCLLSDAASFFSAYSISEEFIDILETMIIILIPNDLLNVRMEGNTSLKPFYIKD